MNTVIVPFQNHKGLSPQAELFFGLAKDSPYPYTVAECNAIMDVLHSHGVVIQPRNQTQNIFAEIFEENIQFSGETAFDVISESAYNLYQLTRKTAIERQIEDFDFIAHFAMRDGLSFVEYPGTDREKVWCNADGSADFVFCFRDRRWVSKEDPYIKALEEHGAMRRLRLNVFS